MRGTDIAQSRGLVTYQWTQPFSTRNPDNSPEAHVGALLIYFPPQNSMRGHCDVILGHHSCLLYSFGGKTTVHVQRKCHNSSVHLLALPAKITIYHHYT